MSLSRPLPSASTARRLWLTRAIKVMGLALIGGFGYVLYATLPSSAPRPAPPELRVSLRDLSDGTVLTLRWGERPIIVLHRTPAMVASLERHDDLVHPAPVAHTAYFVAIDRGTDLGCPLRYIPPGADDTPRRPWPGGFRDSCGGSWYDAAGRVFKGQSATADLQLPPYHVTADDTLILGH